VGKGRLEGDGHQIKNDCERELGKVLDIIGKVIGAGQPAIRGVFLWLFY
jgi:hypothetical protein